MGKKITAVQAKIISQKGTCTLGHKVGDAVIFTELGTGGENLYSCPLQYAPCGFCHDG